MWKFVLTNDECASRTTLDEDLTDRPASYHNLKEKILILSCGWRMVGTWKSATSIFWSQLPNRNWFVRRYTDTTSSKSSHYISSQPLRWQLTFSAVYMPNLTSLTDSLFIIQDNIHTHIKQKFCKKEIQYVMFWHFTISVHRIKHPVYFLDNGTFQL